MKLSKILKKLDKDTIDEMNGMDEAELKTLVVTAEQAISTATQERDSNEKYRQAKLVIKDLGKGLKEVKDRQNAKIQYALRRLRELGGEDMGGDEE